MLRQVLEFLCKMVTGWFFNLLFFFFFKEMLIFLLRFKVLTDFFFFLHMQSAENIWKMCVECQYKWSRIVDILSHKDYVVLDHVQVWMEGGQAARELSTVVLSPMRRVKPWEDPYQSISQNRAGTKQREDHVPQIACDNAVGAPRRNAGLCRASIHPCKKCAIG